MKGGTKTPRIKDLKEHQLFHVTLLAMFLDDITKEGLITRGQRGEISAHIQNQLSKRKK